MHLAARPAAILLLLHTCGMVLWPWRDAEWCPLIPTISALGMYLGRALQVSRNVQREPDAAKTRSQDKAVIQAGALWCSGSKTHLQHAGQGCCERCAVLQGCNGQGPDFLEVLFCGHEDQLLEGPPVIKKALEGPYALWRGLSIEQQPV